MKKSAQLEIRPLRRTDLPEVVDLILAYIDFYERPRLDRGEVEWLVQRLLEHPDEGRQLAAFSDGRMVGFATLYFTFSTLKARRVAVLNDLFVAPDARRSGAGTRLFEICLELVRVEGFAHMEWVTAPDNHPARALYEKMGAERGDWINYSI